MHAGTGYDGNSGSASAPVQTINHALAMAAATATILIAPGEYAEAVVVTKPVKIVGACAAKVTIKAPSGLQALFIQGKSQAAASVSSVRVAGPGRGIAVSGTMPVHFDHVWVSGVQRVGLLLVGSGLVADAASVVIDGTGPDPASLNFGNGIAVNAGPLLALADVRLSANRGTALYVSGNGARVQAERLVVDGTLPADSDGGGGRGVSVESHGEFHLASGRLHGNRDAGLFVGGLGSVATADFVLIDSTRARKKDKAFGVGAGVAQGGSLTLSNARLTDNQETGVLLDGAGSQCTLATTVVDSTLPSAANLGVGIGVSVEAGASLTIDQARVAANRRAGILINGQGTTVNAKDLLVDGTLSRASDGQFGRGITIEDGAKLELQNGWLSGNRDGGIEATGAGVLVRLHRCVVEGTLAPDAGSHLGIGVSVQNGAAMQLDEARLSKNTGLALSVFGDGAQLLARHLLIDGTLPADGVLTLGRGLGVGNGAKILLHGARISDSKDVGLFADGPSTAVVGAGVLIDNTAPQMADSISGRGVCAQKGPSLTLVGSIVAASVDVGIMAQSVGKVRLVGVAVEHTAQDAQGHYGNGMVIGPCSEATLLSCRSIFNHSAAIMVTHTAGAIANSAFGATLPANFPKHDDRGRVTDESVVLADGLVAAATDSLEIDNILFGANARAGLLFQGGKEVRISRSAGAGDLFGLAAFGVAKLEVQGSRFVGTMANRSDGAGLAVPPPPALAEASPPP